MGLGAATLTAALGVAAPSHAEPPPAVTIPQLLTLNDALRLFRSHGLDLLVADASVDTARGEQRIARAILNPSVSIGVGTSGFTYSAANCGSPGCSSTSISVQVSDSAAITDVVAGKRGLRIKVADAALEAAKMDRLDAQRTLEAAIKQQFVQAALAKAALQLGQEARDTAIKTQALVQTRFDKGAVTEADVARTDTARLAADNTIDSSAQTLRESKISLAFLLGARAQVPNYEIDGDFLKTGISESLGPEGRSTLLREALDHRPDLRSAAFQEKRADASLSLARRQRVPDIGLWAQYSQTGVGQAAIQPPTLMLGISTPLPIFYQNQGEIAKAQADVRLQSVQHAKVEATIVANVESSLNAFESADKRVKRTQSALLGRARLARDIIAIQYDKGSTSLLDLLDAQRTFLATSADYLQSLTDYWAAVFSIEQAVGRDLRR